MVFLTKILLRRPGNISGIFKKRFGGFQDTLRIYVKGGAGGMGLPSLGGQGGDGGNVVLVASTNTSLRKVQLKEPSKRYSATLGENSRTRRLKGARGVDVTIPVPVGVNVMTDDGNIIADLNEVGQRVIIAKGGRGGCLATDWHPTKGDKKSIKLDLKLIADVGLVGFPNAGKSTLLGAVSRTQPKIADYPFTTVKPQIGIIHYEDHRQISVADLPGLIEGAHLNRGMGHSFLKHVERTKLLMFIVDINGFQLANKWFFRSALETVALLNLELELYKPELVTKPAVLAINKIDTEGSEEKLKELSGKLHEGDFSHLPEDSIPSMPITFKEIFLISAKEKAGLEPLQWKVRELLDEEAELERRKDEQELQKHGNEQR